MDGIDILPENGDLDGVVPRLGKEDSASRIEPPPTLGKSHSPAPADPQAR
ncbi:hypothetical protein [Paractinoplanes globisporus]|uniref:Uncharacterized protein n=1 Tax=Paractinoplanes globisporus TaxID=113565 RepID=A0ABW6WIG8_9ACTN|nr:hypothetical protein [Actinoplanes globisporus]